MYVHASYDSSGVQNLKGKAYMSPILPRMEYSCSNIIIIIISDAVHESV